MKKSALLSLIRIPPLCAIQRCTSGKRPSAAMAGGRFPVIMGQNIRSVIPK